MTTKDTAPIGSMIDQVIQEELEAGRSERMEAYRAALKQELRDAIPGLVTEMLGESDEPIRQAVRDFIHGSKKPAKKPAGLVAGSRRSPRPPVSREALHAAILEALPNDGTMVPRSVIVNATVKATGISPENAQLRDQLSKLITDGQIRRVGMSGATRYGRVVAAPKSNGQADHAAPQQGVS